MASTQSPKKELVYGQRFISSIVTSYKEGIIPEVLRAIASNSSGMRIERKFVEDWKKENGVLVRRGFIIIPSLARDNQRHSLTIKIGVSGDYREPQTLYLAEGWGSTCSMKPSDKFPAYTLVVGRSLAMERVTSLANLIVGTWVAHGSGWEDSSGNKIPQPYGKIVHRG